MSQRRSHEGRWQPFTPAAHANVQFIVDPETGATVDTFFLAGARLVVRVVAANRSEEPVTWTVTFLSAVNDRCRGAVSRRECIELGMGERFNVVGMVPLFQAPPMDYGTRPRGLRVLWGALGNAAEYPQGFLPRYETFTLPPGGEACRWYLLGTGELSLGDGDIEEAAGRMEELRMHAANRVRARKGDPYLAGINHLATQIALNRRYPSRVESVTSAAFTACPSMDIEYNWDAGYSATGLAVVDEALAARCIEQYLPGSADTVWPQMTG